MRINRLIVLLILGSVNWAVGQHVSNSISGFIEEEPLNTNASGNGNDATEYIQFLEETKINKPILTVEFLESDFPMACISELERESIKHHIHLTGKLICWEELTATGLSKRSIICLKENYTLDTSTTPQLFIRSIKSANTATEFTQTIQQQKTKGSKQINEGAIGDNLHAALRYRYYNTYGISCGINLEKDAGEMWWTKYGPDHIGYFLLLKPLKKNWTVLAGDYDLNIGQGLIHGKRAFNGLSTDVVMVARTGSFLQPHSSMQETGYSRGGVIKYTTAAFNFIFAASRKKQDGALYYDPVTKNYVFTEDQTGYHTTRMQLERRKNNTERNWVALVEWKHESVRIGIEMEGLYSNHKLKISDAPYQVFHSTDQHQHSIGVNYKWQKRNYYLFGELAHVIGDKYGIISGFIWMPGSRVTSALVYRNYSKEFNPKYAAALAQGSRTTNESGLYFGVALRCSDKISLNAYADIYQKPWMTYSTSSPQYGVSHAFKLTFTGGKNVESHLLIRKQSYLDDRMDYGVLPYQIKVTTTQLRWHVTLKPDFGWVLQSRIEYKLNSHSIETCTRNGYLMYQEATFSMMKFNLHVGGRVTVFNTPGYDMAIYSREADLPYNYEQSINYGKGMSVFALIRLSLTKSFSIGMRAGQTLFANRWITDPTTGIIGKNKTAIAMQIRWKLMS